MRPFRSTTHAILPFSTLAFTIFNAHSSPLAGFFHPLTVPISTGSLHWSGKNWSSDAIPRYTLNCLLLNWEITDNFPPVKVSRTFATWKNAPLRKKEKDTQAGFRADLIDRTPGFIVLARIFEFNNLLLTELLKPASRSRFSVISKYCENSLSFSFLLFLFYFPHVLTITCKRCKICRSTLSEGTATFFSESKNEIAYA